MAAQAVNRKLDEEQTTNMIKQAATSAPVRKQRIEEAVRQISYCLKICHNLLYNIYYAICFVV